MSSPGTPNNGYHNQFIIDSVPTPNSATFSFRDAVPALRPSIQGINVHHHQHPPLPVSSPLSAHSISSPSNTLFSPGSVNSNNNNNSQSLSKVAARRRIAPPRALHRAPPTPSTPHWQSGSTTAKQFSASTPTTATAPDNHTLLNKSKKLFSRVRRQYVNRLQSPMSDDFSNGNQSTFSPLQMTPSTSARPSVTTPSPLSSSATTVFGSPLLQQSSSINSMITERTMANPNKLSLSSATTLTRQDSTSSSSCSSSSNSTAVNSARSKRLHGSSNLVPGSSTTLCTNADATFNESTLPPMPPYSRSQPMATRDQKSSGLSSKKPAKIRFNTPTSNSDGTNEEEEEEENSANNGDSDDFRSQANKGMLVEHTSSGSTLPPSPSSMASPNNSSSPDMASPVSSPVAEMGQSVSQPPQSSPGRNNNNNNSLSIPTASDIPIPNNSVLFSPLPELVEEDDDIMDIENTRPPTRPNNNTAKRRINSMDTIRRIEGGNSDDWVEEWVDVETEVAIADARISSDMESLRDETGTITSGSAPIIDAFSGLGIGTSTPTSSKPTKIRRLSCSQSNNHGDSNRPNKTFRRSTSTVCRRLCRSIGINNKQQQQHRLNSQSHLPPPLKLATNLSPSTPFSEHFGGHTSAPPDPGRRLSLTSPFKFSFSPTQFFFPMKSPSIFNENNQVQQSQQQQQQQQQQEESVPPKPRMTCDQMHEHYQLAETYLFGRDQKVPDPRVAVSHLTAIATGPFEQSIQFQALAVLGFCFEFGLGVKSDSVAAERFYLQAAENDNNPLAQNRLIFLYKYGRSGVSMDQQKAQMWAERISQQSPSNVVAWLTMAALEDQHPAAQYALGLCYHNQVGVPEADATKAFELYWLSAQGGHPRGQGILGYCYSEGYGVDQDKVEAFRWYERAAHQGEPVAMYNLGYCYEDGLGVDRNISLAVLWYRRSAELGNALAQNSLGYCHEDGLGLPKDEAKAVEWYTLSAQQGYAWAQCNLGYCYQYGIGVEVNEAQAVNWYCRASEQGHTRAQHNLGFCFQNGLGVDRDLATAFSWYQKAAAQGNTFAYHSLGYCYQNGAGVEANPQLAVYWYRKAAADKHSPALLSLGYCYRNAVGVEKDDTEAFRWFYAAAELGNALAQNALGFCYEEGVGVAKNPQLAFHYYGQAASQNNPWAMCNVGACYAQGLGVSKDTEEACRWYRASAQHGHARAMEKLALVLLEAAATSSSSSTNEIEDKDGFIDVDVERNELEAIRWLCMAAQDHQHPPAMFWLGHCFEHGRGVIQDTEQALGWYRRSIELGETAAFDRVRAIMTREWGVLVTPDGQTTQALSYGDIPPVA